jgi:hypothetical protein
MLRVPKSLRIAEQLQGLRRRPRRIIPYWPIANLFSCNSTEVLQVVAFAVDLRTAVRRIEY